MTNRKISISRRFAMLGMGALTLASTRTAFGQTAANGNKLIIVILRGALDGLAAVPRINDRDLKNYRRDLIPQNIQPLSDGFGLHPELKTLHNLYQSNEASILHAVAGPYRERSHFLAQDLLEAGTQADVTSDGWLTRALQSAPQPLSAISIGPSTPLILRGAQNASSWSPPALPDAGDDTIARLMRLYEGDVLLQPALEKAISLADMANGSMKTPVRGNPYQVSLAAAGRLLSVSGGPDIAVVPVSGWDTHANQPAALTTRLRQLDNGIAALKDELGPLWAKSAIAIVTEFGRTVRQNGTRGTDHGTAGAAFILGGAIKGGKVLGDWPGLKSSNLYEGRDLRASSDLRSLFKGLLELQFGFTPADLSRGVFPDSTGVNALRL